MKKADRLRLEARTTYKVTKAFGDTGHSYNVTKHVDGEHKLLDSHMLVTVKWDKEKEPYYPVVIWCSCSGFKCQKFAHIDHKHIKLVLDFQKHGEPDEVLYKIHGTGGHTEIEHIASMWIDDVLGEEDA